MTNDKKIIGTMVALTLLLLAGILALGSKSAPSTNQPIKVTEGQLVRPDSQSIGTPGAPVTIVEFADFQCPACGAVHPVLTQIINDYRDRILFVHRHFPLPTHQHADLAARAAEAAGAQGKFWEMHDRIFEQQAQWSSAIEPQSLFVRYAVELGLNEEQFRTDLTNQTLIDRIRLDVGDGDALGVNSTPTIFINGQKLAQPVSYELLKTTIEAGSENPK